MSEKQLFLHGARYAVEFIENTDLDTNDTGLILGHSVRKKEFKRAVITLTNDTDEIFFVGDEVIVDVAACITIEFENNFITLVNAVDIIGVYYEEEGEE